MRELRRKTTIALFAALFLTSLLFLFYSCEIGLGSAVDVEAPSLTIDSPAVDSVIRDKFALKGTWNDDGTIDGITAELKRTDNNAKPVEIKGVFSREDKEVDGIWSVIVDPVKEQLVDGTYQATVTIKDKSNHKTIQSTTFTIDNTPPVLILKKPSSAFVEGTSEDDISSPSVFGKSLYLEGSIADLTKETWIQIDFYSDKECTEANKLYSIETESIAPTDVNQNNTRYATYEEEPETQNLVKNAYYYIYKKNETKNGAEEIYAKLTVYDTAELFPIEDESSESTEDTDGSNSSVSNVTEKGHIKGNSTHEFYISSDLAKDLTKSVGMGGKGYAPIDIYKILNGTEDLLESTRTADATLSKKAELEEALKEKAKTTSVFSINPDNNPYFTVSGLKTLTESGSDFATADNGYYIKNGALTLEISVFMGSDSFEIDSKDPEFYAYLIECDENGEPSKPDIEANRIKLYSKFKETGSGKDKKQLFKIGGNEESKTNTGVYIFSVPINKTVNTNTDEGVVEVSGLVYGHNYLIRVNGKDVEGNIIDNETNKYGFRFTSSGAAPEITIKEPSKNYVNLKKGDNLKIKGEVKTEESDISLSIFMGSETKPFANVELETTENPSIYEFEYTIPWKNQNGTENFSQTQSKEYSISVTASGEAKASSYLTISYDVDGPVITKDRELPSVQSNGTQDNCINGNFTITGIITDDYDVFGSATYKVVQEINGQEVVKVNETSIPSKFSIPVNTLNLLDEKPATIIIVGKDRSGNETEERFEYYVDQRTDKPVISNDAENINLDAENYSDITNPYNSETNDYYNMFQRKSNLYLNIQDDDGLVHTVTVDLSKYKIVKETVNGEEVDKAVPATDEQGNEIKVTQAVEHSRDVIQYTLPDEEGIYKALVRAYDINYDFTNPDESEGNNNYSQKSFFLKVTGNGPDVTLSPEKDFISTLYDSAELKITFNVTDVGNGPYKINMDKGDGQGYKPLFNGEAKTSPFDVTLNYNQGTTTGTTVKFIVKDKNNVGTEKSFTPKFDNEVPVIEEFTDGGYPKSPERTEEATFFFKGNLNDHEAQDKVVSGVEKAYIRYVSGEYVSVQAAIDAASAQSNPAASTDWIEATTNGKTWNYEATWASTELISVFNTEGKKTVIVKAVDGAGNEAMMCKSFVYDKAKPEVTSVMTKSGADYINGDSAEVLIKYCDTNLEDETADENGNITSESGENKNITIQVFDLLDNDVSSSITIKKSLDLENYPDTVAHDKTTKTIIAEIPFPKTRRTNEEGAETSNVVEDGSYKIKIIVTDQNDRASTTKEYQITRDTSDPELDNISMSTDSSVNKVYNPTDHIYFVNNLEQEFTIAGVAKDNIGVANVHLEIFRIKKSKTDSTTEPVVDSDAKITKNTTTQIWSFENIDLSGSYWTQETDEYKTLGAKATITVTDKAGNSTSQDLTITFDTTGPVAKHEIDAKGKDLYFRIGNSNNDDITSLTASNYGLAWNNDSTTNKIDEDVGSKYSNGAYGNDMTIQIRGNFDDKTYGTNGSGVKTIYYQVSKNETLISGLLSKPEYANKTEDEVLALFAKAIKDDTTGLTKSFSPLETPETKRVFYNSSETTDTTIETYPYDGTVGGKISGGTQLIQQSPQKPTAKFYKDVETNFKNSITGFTEGSNYLILVAEDYVGNISIDVAKDVPYTNEHGQEVTGTFVNYSLNVDTVVPEITTASDEILYTNKQGVVELSGTVNDKNAGLRSLSFKLNNTDLDIDCAITTTEFGDNQEKQKNTWSIAIPASSFANSSTTYTVYATAKDNAGNGNETKLAVGTIRVDEEEPTVKISSPKANTEINKEIVFEGNVQDENGGSGINGDKAPKLYWTIDPTAKDTDPDPDAEPENLPASASEGWVELIFEGDDKDDAAKSKHWNKTTYNWDFTVDTTKLKADGTNEVSERTTAYFTVCATDNSGNGNTGYAAAHEVVIDQNSDRPVITMNQIAKDTETTLRIKNVYGTISDDDGIKKLWYWPTSRHKTEENPTGKPTDTDILTTSSVPDGWIEIPVSTGGSWSIDSDKEPDGETYWYLAIQDTKDTIFCTTNNTALDRPYVNYSDTTEKQDNENGIKFKYDTNPPTPTYLGLVRYPTGTTTAVDDIYTADTNEDDDDDIAWSTSNNIAFGGDYNVLYAKIEVQEGTDMKALSGSEGSAPTSSPVLISYKNADGATYSYNYEQIKADVSSTDSSKYTYYLGPLTMDTTAAVEFKVTVEDAVGNKGFISRNIIVDNEAPTEVSNLKPNAQGEQNGTFSYRGDAKDNLGGSGVEKVEWCIPNSTQTTTSADGLTWTEAPLTSQWEIDFSGANNLSDIIGYTIFGNDSDVGLNYRAYETDTTNHSGVYNIPVWFRLTDAVGNVGYDITNGRIKYNPNTDRPSVLIVNPVHNKTAKINNEKINYVIMGGSTARITGSADDDEGIADVFLQFDMDGDGIWDTGVSGLSKDLAIQPTDSTPMIPGTPWKGSAITEIATYKNSVKTTSQGYGIKVGTTKNWGYTIDLSYTDLPKINEIKNGNEYTYDGNTIKIRAIAIDNDTSNGQLASAWSEVLNVSVSNEIPLFNNLKLKQIENNVEVSEKDYVAGMYLKGTDWYLTGDVSTSGGISEASYDGCTNAMRCFTAKTGGESQSQKQFDMKIPVEIGAGTSWNVTIRVVDDTGDKKSNTQAIQLNVDNTPPAFAETYASENVNTNGTVKHYMNAYGAKGTELTPTTKLYNLDGYASLWGRISDNGSGFDKAVFYFKRTDAGSTSNPRVYNLMEECDQTPINASHAVGMVYINTTQDTGDNLPALCVKTDATAKMTVTRPSEYSIKVELGTGATVTGVSGNNNIRVGGLVKIGGLYRTITAVSGDTVTFTPACETSFVEAEFIYGMVIDSSGETKTGGSINESDHDGLLENFQTINGTTTWNAALPTDNIPDGPIELHVVVFDAAGNFNHGYTKTGIENKPLRITSVKLGTDFNGNDSFDNSEYETFYALMGTNGSADRSRGKDVWKLDTKHELGGASYFTAKKGLSVIPEFVGGSGDVYYKFEKSDADITEPTTLTTEEVSGNSHKLSSQTTNSEGNITGKLVLDNDKINKNTFEYNGTDNESVWFNFSFWDSTDGATVGQNSSWTVLSAQMTQDLEDDTAPNVVIEPFRWAGAGSSTANAQNTTEVVRKFKYSTVKGNTRYSRFYTDEACTTLATNDTALTADVYTKETVSINSLYHNLTSNGHIELSADLPESNFPPATTTGEFDRDPKVSGKITFSGTAYDNVSLSSIWFTFDGFTPAEETYTLTKKTVNVGTTESPVNKTFYQAALYNKTNAIWETASATIADGWEFTVSEEEGQGYFNQYGHKVRWTLSIDTALISGGVGTDKTLYMLVIDQNEKVSSLTVAATDSQKSADEGTNNVPSYRVDVVPYIMGIKTGLSSLKKANSSVYDRTALGHYSVAETEDIYLYGFNLNGGTLYDSSTTPKPAELTEIDVTNSLKWFTSGFPYNKAYKTTYNMDVTPTQNGVSQFISGEVYVEVGEVESLNNKNNNDSFGTVYSSMPSVEITGDKDIYNDFYNRQPNGDNNNLLTDNVVLDIWQITPQAVTPISGYATQPVMAINPKNHDVGFAFVNSTLYFSMPNSGTNSYKTWIGGYDFWTSIGLAYDTFGYAYGTAAGGDIADNRADTFRIMTSRWGPADTATSGYDKGTNQYRLEYIAQADYSGSDTAVFNFNKERIRSPSIATVAKSATAADGTKVYLAYYDEINDEIRFKHGELTNTKIKNWYKYTHDEETAEAGRESFYGDFYGRENAKDDRNPGWGDINKDVVASEWLGKSTLATRGGWYHLAHNSLIAVHTTDKEYIPYSWVDNALTAGTRTSMTTAVTTDEETPQPVYAGKYVSIAAIPNGGTDDDAVIAVWWDAEHSQLLYSYNLTPNSIQVGQYSQADTKWTKPVAIFGEENGIGEYCKVAVSGNSVHIAAYDGLNGDLYYAYISNFTTPNAAKTCIVDSYGIIGTELNIDVALDENDRPVPYISYYAGNCARPKIAYWSGTKNILTDTFVGGAEDDLSTGEWEISIVPTESKVSVDHINVGVWKDGNGKLNWSTKDAKKPNGKAAGVSGSNIGKTTPGTSNGMVWGNGSMNPILGYAITQGSKGYIETAQMK